MVTNKQLITRALNPMCAITLRDLLRICWLEFNLRVWIPVRYITED